MMARAQSRFTRTRKQLLQRDRKARDRIVLISVVVIAPPTSSGIKEASRVSILLRMQRSEEDPRWPTRAVIWERESSEDSSEWLDIPLYELTFAEFQFVHVSDSVSPCITTGSGGDTEDCATTSSTLPMVEAFRTGITFEQWAQMQQHAFDTQQKGQRRKGRRILFTILGLFVVIFSSLCTVLVIYLSKPATPQMLPFNANFSTPMERHLWDTISDFSDARIIADPSSPQRKAWSLILSEVYHDSSGKLMQDTARIRQRFALSTLFFLSTTWQPQTALHECFWFMDHGGGQRGIVNCTDGNITNIYLCT